MNNKKLNLGIICSFFFIIFAGCNLYGAGGEVPPYSVTGKIVSDSSSTEYEKGGFECTFENKSNKTVKEIFVTFALFDGNGDPLKQIAVNIESNVLPSEKKDFCINIDEVLPEEGYEKCDVDFIYASKIIYDDSSEWSDPMGLRYFFY